jgi:hypothetical protein
MNKTFIAVLIVLLILGCKTIEKKSFETSEDPARPPTKTIQDSVLQHMNNVFIPDFLDTCNVLKHKKIKIMIIGNSLSLHGIAPKIGWTHEGGMAASTKEKDYAHLLFKKLEAILPEYEVCMRISNFASFERNPNSLDDRSIENLLSFKADIIIFQLGENVDETSSDNLRNFEKKYIQLINSFRKNDSPLTICTTPFFPSLTKNKIMNQIALNTKSNLVDLSSLTLLDPKNYAKNEVDYAGDKSAWIAEGIGIHPGDIGMQNIANLIFTSVQPYITSKSF